MQWGQIKTVFILCFLILNIFLVKQLIDRQDEEITTLPETSREEELEFNINGLNDLSEDEFTAQLVSAQNYNYNEQAETELSALTNQQGVVIDDHYLMAEFDDPIAFNVEDSEAKLADHVLVGDRFSYWGEIESANMLVLFQQLEYPVFFNPNALLLIQMNVNGEMTHYVQTQLSIVDEPGERRSLIKQYDAVYRLYHHSNALEAGDTISNVLLGYHNLVSLPNGEQLLNPTWDIQVNNRAHHFVNAIDGHNYPQNDQFFEENIASLIELLDQSDPDDRTYYQIKDDQEELVARLRQALVGAYNNLIEVESE